MVVLMDKEKRRCEEPECTEIAISRGKCRRHYAQWYINHKKLHIKPKERKVFSIPRGKCRFSGCNAEERNNYLCEEHYQLVFRSHFELIEG